MPVNDKYPKINLREYPDYTPRNTLGLTLKAAAVCAGSGIFASAVKNSLEKTKGAGFFHPKTGYYTFMFAAVGSAYTFGEAVATNLREKEDSWNSAFGGVFAGAVLGASFKSIPKVVGFGLLTGSAIGLFEFAGGLEGFGREKALARKGEVITLEDDQKQGFWDVVNRRPLSQTVDELGDLVRPFK